MVRADLAILYAVAVFCTEGVLFYEENIWVIDLNQWKLVADMIFCWSLNWFKPLEEGEWEIEVFARMVINGDEDLVFQERSIFGANYLANFRFADVVAVVHTE